MLSSSGLHFVDFLVMEFCRSSLAHRRIVLLDQPLPHPLDLEQRR